MGSRLWSLDQVVEPGSELASVTRSQSQPMNFFDERYQVGLCYWEEGGAGWDGF